MKNLNSVIKTICFIFSFSFILSACGSKEIPQTTVYNFYFDTYTSITIPENFAECGNEALSKLDFLEKQCFSKSCPDSDIYRINHSNGETVKCHEETIELLLNAIEFAKSDIVSEELTPTLGALIELWNISPSNENFRIPDIKQIDEALSHSSLSDIIIDEDNRTVTVTDINLKLDLGAYAKGYAADLITAYLKMKNVPYALINLGGNIMAIGEKSVNTPFTIGIKTPYSDNDYMETIPLYDSQSAVTSGSYERYVEFEGTKYCHILSHSTGYPVQNDLLSVTIIGPSSLICDEISTLCFLKGKEESIRLLRDFPDYYAVFIDTDMNVSFSR